MMKKIQSYIELTVTNWENTDLGIKVHDIVESAKEYENDDVIVEQFIPSGQMDDEWKFLIILSISRDLNNMGDLISAPSR